MAGRTTRATRSSSAGALFAAAAEPHSIAGDEAIEPVPRRQAAGEMQEGGERPEQWEFSGKIAKGRRPAVHAAVHVDDDHFFEEPLARHFGKVAGHPLIVERGEGESMPAIRPPEVRHALPAKCGKPPLRAAPQKLDTRPS